MCGWGFGGKKRPRGGLEPEEVGVGEVGGGRGFFVGLLLGSRVEVERVWGVLES